MSKRLVTKPETLQRFPMLMTKGFVIHPPIADLALEVGDSYSFTYGGETIFTVFDGCVWRLVHAEQTGLPTDIDSSVVTVL